MTTEIIRPRESHHSLKKTTRIDQSFKEPIQITENIPRLLSLQTFIKDLSEAKRGFGLRRQNKATKAPNSAPRIQAPKLSINNGQNTPRQVPLTDSCDHMPTTLDYAGGQHNELQDSVSQQTQPVTAATSGEVSLHKIPSPLNTVGGKYYLHSIAGDAVVKDNTVEQSTNQYHVSESLVRVDRGIAVSDGPYEVTEPPKVAKSVMEEGNPDVGVVTGVPRVHNNGKTRQDEGKEGNITQTFSLPIRTISVLSRPRGVPIFGKMSDELYEARRLRPDEDSVRQWTTSWKPTITKRLRDMHLGPHVITNLRFCMMGRNPDESNMRPTILLVCSESKRKDVQTGLTDFIRVSVPAGVDFRVVSSIIKPASGGSFQLEEDKSNLGARMKFTAPEDLITLLGTQMRIQTRDRHALYPVCTVGGIINVGETLYALSVAHSMFGQASEVEDQYSTLDWVSFGKVKSYHWAGNGTPQKHSHSTHAVDRTPEIFSPRPSSIEIYVSDDQSHRKIAVGLERGLDRNSDQHPTVPNNDTYVHTDSSSTDWMLIRLASEFMLPNIFHDLNESTDHNVSGFWRSEDLEDGDVFVCGGVGGSQYGILDVSPATILYGDVLYDVLSIALEHPLAEGDSGAWVIKENKLCGYMFARIDEKPWGYMLAIEPIFREISKTLSPGEKQNSVDVPMTSTINFLRALEPTNSSAAESLEFDLTPAPSQGRQLVPGEDARFGISRPASEYVLAMPTREPPLPPSMRETNAVGNRSHSPTWNALSLAGGAAAVQDPNIANTKVVRYRMPLFQWIRQWDQEWLSVLGKKVKLILEVLGILMLIPISLSPLAGIGYLIYYIAKKTSLPIYAKVLASIAAWSILVVASSIYYTIRKLWRRRQRSLSETPDLQPRPPEHHKPPEIATTPFELVSPVELVYHGPHFHGFRSELSSGPPYELSPQPMQEIRTNYPPSRVPIGYEIV